MRLASRGTRENDDGDVAKVDDEANADALRRQARRLHVQSLVVAAIATVVLVLLPL